MSSLDKFIISVEEAARFSARGPLPSALSGSQQRPRNGEEWPQIADLRSELARDAPQLSHLRHPLPARVIELIPGQSDVDLAEMAGESFGLLVLDGLLMVELEAGRAHIGWLVGSGDLVRPAALTEQALTDRSRWHALSGAVLALLDNDLGVLGDSGAILSRILVSRATRTANWLLAKSLIASSPLIEERLLLMFALFGERWGKVTRKGVLVRLPLTHRNLAVLCGARRPSVTTALHALETEGLLSRTGKGSWLLRRTCSKNGSRPACFGDYERSLGLGVLDLGSDGA